MQLDPTSVLEAARPDFGGRGELAPAPYELQPQPPRGPRPRVTGPGRIELGLRAELAARESRLQEAARAAEFLGHELRSAERALEASQQVERGCQRRLDRVETRLEERTAALLESQAQHKRLSALIGALQRENELLREQLALGQGETRRLTRARATGARRQAGERASWWRRWLSGSR